MGRQRVSCRNRHHRDAVRAVGESRAQVTPETGDIVIVLVSWGCYPKVPQVTWLKTAEFCSVSALEVRSMKSRR